MVHTGLASYTKHAQKRTEGIGEETIHGLSKAVNVNLWIFNGLLSFLQHSKLVYTPRQ